MDPNGKNAIVTGGANGIGKRVVEMLAGEGARLGVLDLDADALEELANERPGVRCLVCDVSDPVQVDRAVDEFCRRFSTVDLLINNAGTIYSSPLIGLQEGRLRAHEIEAWDRVVAANLSGVFYVTRAVVQRMAAARTRGVIVNVSSVCASGNPGQSAYSAAKAGVNALTAVWAAELAPFRIRVAGIAPGYTETDTTIRSMSPAKLQEWKGRVPLRRLGKVDEIAQGILYLVKSDFFHGKTLQLDGGLRL